MLCDYCGKEIINGNVFISTGNGVAHRKCYYLKNPFIPKQSFSKVLRNIDDTVLVWELLEKHLTLQQKETIRIDFNKIMQKRYDRQINE